MSSSHSCPWVGAQRGSRESPGSVLSDVAGLGVDHREEAPDAHEVLLDIIGGRARGESVTGIRSGQPRVVRATRVVGSELEGLAVTRELGGRPVRLVSHAGKRTDLGPVARVLVHASSMAAGPA